MVCYAHPVHCFDPSAGTWLPIDNSLEFSQGDGFAGWKNKRGRFGVKFAYAASGNQLMSIEKDGYKLSWRLLGNINSAEAQIIATPPPEEAIPDFEGLDNLISEIRYNDFVDGADLQYIVSESAVKENIIVKTPLANHEFAFRISAANLSFGISEEGGIESLDENKAQRGVFSMPPPYMTDAGGVLSYDVSYKVENQEGGEYTLRIVPNEEWLNAPDRQYPVIIDPTITLVGQPYIQSKSLNANRQIDHVPPTIHSMIGAMSAGVENLPIPVYTFYRFSAPANLPANNRVWRITLAFLAHRRTSGGTWSIKDPTKPTRLPYIPRSTGESPTVIVRLANHGDFDMTRLPAGFDIDSRRGVDVFAERIGPRSDSPIAIIRRLSTSIITLEELMTRGLIFELYDPEQMDSRIVEFWRETAAAHRRPRLTVEYLPPLNLTFLDNLITQAAGLNERLYTANSWNRLQLVLRAAIELRNTAQTQTQIDWAADDIRLAIGMLEKFTVLNLPAGRNLVIHGTNWGQGCSTMRVAMLELEWTQTHIWLGSGSTINLSEEELNTLAEGLRGINARDANLIIEAELVRAGESQWLNFSQSRTLFSGGSGRIDFTADSGLNHNGCTISIETWPAVAGRFNGVMYLFADLSGSPQTNWQTWSAVTINRLVVRT